MTPSETIIGIFTGNGPKYEARRELCRKTWFGELRRMGFKAYFIGTNRPDSPFRGDDEFDTRFVDVQEGWDHLPQKTRAFAETALTIQGWNRWVKGDDDSFIHPERLAAFLSTLPADVRYVGADMGTVQRMSPYASGGACYVLDRDAVCHVADELTATSGHEDVMVGAIMRKSGIPFHHDPRFIPFGMVQGFPQRGNDIITSHALDAETWMKAWKNR
jgi:hypothetical protein